MSAVRDWIGLQKEMLQEIGSMLSILLLTVNLSITLYLLLRADSGVFANGWLVIPAFILVMGSAIWFFARTWHFVGMMHKSKQRAIVVLNPFLTTDFNPHEWVLWNYVSLPQLRAQRDLMAKLGMETKEIDEVVKRLEGWLADGRIPKDDFPATMRPYLKAV